MFIYNHVLEAFRKWPQQKKESSLGYKPERLIAPTLFIFLLKNFSLISLSYFIFCPLYFSFASLSFTFYLEIPDTHSTQKTSPWPLEVRGMGGYHVPLVKHSNWWARCTFCNTPKLGSRIMQQNLKFLFLNTNILVPCRILIQSDE